jgi:AraC family transcriptional regulator
MQSSTSRADLVARPFTTDAADSGISIYSLHVESMTMKPANETALQDPRFATGRQLLIVGLNARHDYESRGSGIPAQWDRFAPSIGTVPGQVGTTKFGVRHTSDDEGLDYLCGVEVKDFSNVPAELTRVRIAPHRYAVFTHRGHVAAIRSTWSAIWEWLPQSGHQIADAPDFECYDERFDWRTGTGEVEIWVPI